MEFSQFIDLPAQLKIQIITKCSPFSYVRLRRTCRFVDEFCEKYRNRLSVYCPKNEFYAGLRRKYKDGSYRFFMRGNKKKVKLSMTPDNMVKINKALSGFVIAESSLDKFTDKNYDNYNNALIYFLEAAPDFKVNFLFISDLKAEQVERVMASKWKIGGVKVECQLEMGRILKIERIRKMDSIFFSWSPDDLDFTEDDIVQLSRGKKSVRLYPEFLSTSSRLNALKRIVQNWKNDGHFPIRFYMNWKIEKQYMDADISGLFSEIMDQEAFYIGRFLGICEYMDEVNDIWIRKDNKIWQFVSIKRESSRLTDLKESRNEAFFNFESAESITDLIEIMRNCLRDIYYVKPVEEPSLYEACLAENMEKIKEAFVNMIREVEDDDLL